MWSVGLRSQQLWQPGLIGETEHSCMLCCQLCLLDS